MLSHLTRPVRAERLGPFFEVQLRLANHVAQRTGEKLGDVSLRLTCFHRRFGLGNPAQPAWAWTDYSDHLETLDQLEEQVAWTQRFYLAAPDEPESSAPRFGCFSCEAPDASGVVRIHFSNCEGGEYSPLHRANVSERQAEVAALAAYVQQRFPDAQRIRGVSWLYNLDAYLRLFPAAYVSSARPAEGLRLNGLSSWGQFIDRNGQPRRALIRAFLDNLNRLDLSAPWRAFPLRALVVEAPLSEFLHPQSS